MAHTLVKILTYDDGTEVERPAWHWIENAAATDRTLCDGVAFGEGDSSAEYELKTVAKGGITCEACLSKIRAYKAIKL